MKISNYFNMALVKFYQKFGEGEGGVFIFILFTIFFGFYFI